MAVLNVYFGFLYRMITFCYSLKRLNRYKRKLEVVVSNLALGSFGFKNIRNKIKVNKRCEAIGYAGENYEYSILNEKSVKKLDKFLSELPAKEKIEFMDVNKVSIENIRVAKPMFVAMDQHLKSLRYLTIQQCHLCPNFILQFKTFLDGNESLVRLSVVLNYMKEEDCFQVLLTCLEHPNLEILQLCERVKNEEEDNGKKKRKKKRRNEDEDSEDEEDESENKSYDSTVPNKVSLCKEVQARMSLNETLVKLEIRFLPLNIQFLQCLFRGLAQNNAIQKLLLTDDALMLANQNEFEMLGQALKTNSALLSLDVSNNTNFDDNLGFHSEITDCLINSPTSELQKIYITTISVDIKTHYLELIDQKPGFFVFVNNKMLEDVDIQE